MRRAINICGFFCASVISVQLFAAAVFAQQDKLVGRWEGKLQSPQGERETNLVIKNEGGVYTGVMPGMRQGMEIQLKDLKIDGDKLTARADVEAPQGALTINYSFTLAGETLKGQGSLDFGARPLPSTLTSNASARTPPPRQPRHNRRGNRGNRGNRSNNASAWPRRSHSRNNQSIISPANGAISTWDVKAPCGRRRANAW